MRLLRYLARNINALNIVLIAAAAVLAVAVFYPHFYGQVKYGLPAVKLSPEVEAEPEAVVASPSMSDFLVIAEQNLFHPDRKIPPEKKEAQQLPKPELILYGTLIGEGMSVAYVEDKKNPKTSPGRGKRQTVMKKGDAVSGFVLKEIETDKIVLVRGDETMVVHLSQGDKPRTSEVPPGAPGAPGAARPAQPTPQPVRPATPVPAKPGSPTPAPQQAGTVSPPAKAEPTRTFAPPIPRGVKLSPPKGPTQTQQGAQ